MPTDHTDLQGRRVDAVRAWTAFVEQGDGAEGLVRPEILHSWQRSRAALTSEVTEAPLADESETAAFWNGSPLQTAVSRVESDLRRTAEDGDLVIAVTDAETRVLWTYGGRVMRRKAETVNFVPGGRWDDASVGTNALDLANRVGAPSMVFSAEHYASIVHNWVCWAAPVHDPATGEQLGVIDLSTTWDRTHPIGLATARVMARLIETAMPDSSSHPRTPRDVADDRPGLSLHLLGAAEARLDGQRLLLNRRQTEILALLAMHPEGLSLEHLHALLYGDQSVTLSTLKAEVSHLRSALGGQLSSRARSRRVLRRLLLGAHGSGADCRDDQRALDDRPHRRRVRRTSRAARTPPAPPARPRAHRLRIAAPVAQSCALRVLASRP